MVCGSMWDVGAGVTGADAPDAGERTEVLGTEALIAALQARAQAAVDEGSAVRALVVRCGTPACWSLDLLEGLLCCNHAARGLSVQWLYPLLSDPLRMPRSCLS